MSRLALAATLALLGLTGCTTRGTGLVWWNPTTWASRAAPAAADRALEKRDDAAQAVARKIDDVVRATHLEIAKTGRALAAAPDSRAVLLARRTNDNALGLMAQVQPLSAEDSATVRQLVADLLSDKAEIAAAAEQRQREAEGKALTLAAELGQARAKLEQREAALASANASLREAYDRENALAAQVRNFWFIAGLLAVLWIGGNLLAAVARFYPPLAPLSRAVNGIAAPALAFAEARATDGLRKVGYAMARARTAIPEAADRLTELMDQETDRDHQTTIGTAANTAPRA